MELCHIYEERFTIQVISPFRLDLTVWALRRRQKNLIDRWDGKQYRRVFIIEGKIVSIVVTQKSETELTVVSKSTTQKSLKEAISKLLQKTLGTDTNLDAFYRLAEKDAYIQPLVSRFKGVKPPRFPTMYEALVNAIACQQVTLDLGIALLNKLAEKYGRRFGDANVTHYAFPLPEDLAKTTEEDIKKLGFSYQKARTINTLSKLLVEGKISFETMDAALNIDIIDDLTKIRGIGRWSAEYALLRGLGRIDTFPGDDVGAQNNLKRIFTLDAKPDYEVIHKLTEPWGPYAGFVYFHLLLDTLQKKQLI